MESQYFTNQQLFSYAYLATSFDLKKDIFKNYICLIEYYLLEHKYQGHEIGFDTLHDDLNSSFGLEMPKATLQKLLKDMQREGKAKITGSGISFNTEKFSIKYLDIRDSVDNEFQILFRDMLSFFSKKAIKLNIDQVKDLIFQFIASNSTVIIELYSNVAPSIYDLGQYAQEIIEYIYEIKEQRKQIYNTLLKLTMGAIRASVLNLTPEKIKDLDRDEIIIQTVILDTNFLLRLLALQGRTDCKIAEETFGILKKLNVECVVLDITLDETLSSISNYLFQTDCINPYTKDVLTKSNVRLSGFLAAEQQGISRAEMLKYRNRAFIIQKIEALGIKIVDAHVVLPQKDLSELINEQDLGNLILEKNRISYTRENAIHDLTLIEYCKLLRSSKQKSVSQEKVWVLTNDSKLANWHKSRCNNFGYACITESQLTSYIWILNGNTGIELNYAILALSSQNSISIEQVERFQRSYLNYVQTGSPQNIKDLALVFASGDIKTADFTDINDNETMETFIARQISEIKEKQRLDALEAETQTDILKAQTETLNEKLNNTTHSIEIERQQLTEEYKQYRDKKSSIQEDIEKKTKEIDKRKFILRTFKLRGVIIWCVLLFSAVASFLIPFLLFKQFYVGEDKQEWLRTLVPLFCTVVLPFLLAFITTCFFGRPMKFTDVYMALQTRFCSKKMNALLGKTLSPQECKAEIESLNSQIVNDRQHLTNCKLEIGKIEFAISRMDNLG